MNKKIDETKEQQKAIVNFTEKFRELMAIMGKHNQYGHTFSLEIAEQTNYGFTGKIVLRTGLTFEMLPKQAIEQNLQCLMVIKPQPFSDYAIVDIITKPVDESVMFKKLDVKPNEVYIGKNFDLTNRTIDANKFCHFLIAGSVGSGKTRMLYSTLLAWHLNCEPGEVEIYLSDICKNEFLPFANTTHVTYYAYELEMLHEMMQKVKKRIENRKNQIAPLREKGIATNIEEFNATQKEKLSYIYVVIDEFHAIVPDATDSEEEAKMKHEIIDSLKYVCKVSRSLGIFTVIATQKCTVTEIPSILKNMSATRLSFKANDQISSEVIMGNSSAVGLANRIAVFSTNGGEEQDYVFSSTLTTENMSALIKPYLKTVVKKPQSIAQRGFCVQVDKLGMPILNSLTAKFNATQKGDGIIDYGA